MTEEISVKIYCVSQISKPSNCLGRDTSRLTGPEFSEKEVVRDSGTLSSDGPDKLRLRPWAPTTLSSSFLVSLSSTPVVYPSHYHTPEPLVPFETPKMTSVLPFNNLTKVVSYKR